MIENKYDVIQWIGNKVCAAGTQATSFLIEQPTCTAAESWNMGALVLAAAVVVIAVVWIAERRRARRDGYYWR